MSFTRPLFRRHDVAAILAAIQMPLPPIFTI